jgi:hybrid cluster-associated redox disulfide protein
MRSDVILDLSLADIMSDSPSTIGVFLSHQMRCVGCPIAPFHTLPDAAREHGLPLKDLAEEIEALLAAPTRRRAARHRR